MIYNSIKRQVELSLTAPPKPQAAMTLSSKNKTRRQRRQRANLARDNDRIDVQYLQYNNEVVWARRDSLWTRQQLRKLKTEHFKLRMQMMIYYSSCVDVGLDIKWYSEFLHDRVMKERHSCFPKNVFSNRIWLFFYIYCLRYLSFPCRLPS